MVLVIVQTYLEGGHSNDSRRSPSRWKNKVDLLSNIWLQSIRANASIIEVIGVALISNRTFLVVCAKGRTLSDLCSAPDSTGSEGDI